MGLLRSLVGNLTGYSALKEDANVLLAEASFEAMPEYARRLIVERVVFIMRSTEGLNSDQDALQKLNKQSRYVQLLFVSIACSNVGVPPLAIGWQWEPVRNPYSSGDKVDDFRINSLARTLKEKHGVVVHWPGSDSRIDFSIYLSASSAVESDAKSTSAFTRDDDRAFAEYKRRHGLT